MNMLRKQEKMRIFNQLKKLALLEGFVHSLELLFCKYNIFVNQSIEHLAAY